MTAVRVADGAGSSDHNQPFLRSVLGNFTKVAVSKEPPAFSSSSDRISTVKPMSDDRFYRPILSADFIGRFYQTFSLNSLD